MKQQCVSLDIHDIWSSPVVVYMNKLLSENWSSIGLTTEIESRLGKVGENGFVSGVNMKYFYGMRDYLLTKNYWTDENGKHIRPVEDNEYAVVFEDHVRVVLVQNNDKYSILEAIRKKSRDKKTFHFGDSIFALRIAVADEMPLTEQERSQYSEAAINYLTGKPVKGESRITLVRHRQRTSFNYNNEYRLDLTVIQAGHSEKDLKTVQPVYEIECELGIPKHSHCEQLFIYLNAILHRMMSQPDTIAIPPVTSKFHPNVFRRAAIMNCVPVLISGDILLKSSEGYNDELIQWCIKYNSEGKAILPFHLAKQIQWLCSHPPQLFTLQDDLWIIEVSKEYLDYVICNGGTIRTDDGRVFHCCIGQYEGFHLKTSFSSQKRVIPMKFPVCSKSVHFLSFLYWSFSRNPLVYIPFFVVISNQILVSY
ncbi:hypothetical protein JH06_0762 [Blastocystis sp. subtype 4]|uniref:hypothetical protein n=1 Tax=Blastocystis sp. subtype 4 TaxID=944170 RepID=UPI000712009C|nr:hypothetical protein JH06_0762 [Blastocystis sp. subtype 4]KNB46669.1 hypothetical protein JH06_0762 [Blastocystis sp. subtype 4]|eukprot:XP_014530101.1 hypothetical protein JH06_0762 [Blastocystis sp. subtype 4]